jgi:predicted RNase H-like HicB family nuclease
VQSRPRSFTAGWSQPEVPTGKTLDHYVSLPYPILLIPNPEGGSWFVEIPLLPGCMSDGPTVEEALANLWEAQTLWLEVAIERKHTIKEPQPDKTFTITITYS